MLTIPLFELLNSLLKFILFHTSLIDFLGRIPLSIFLLYSSKIRCASCCNGVVNPVHKIEKTTFHYNGETETADAGIFSKYPTSRGSISDRKWFHPDWRRAQLQNVPCPFHSTDVVWLVEFLEQFVFCSTIHDSCSTCFANSTYLKPILVTWQFWYPS